LDIGRIGDFLARVKTRMRLKKLEHVSPFAVPTLMEIGRERAPGYSASEMALEEASALIREAMG
jgi:ATP-dependent Lhr-like helicase